MRSVRFDVPLFLERGVRKKRNIWLNMNNYRNWQHFLSNDLKVQFKGAISIPELDTPLAACRITYTFYYPTHQRRDIGNSLAVISKFTEDALVESIVIMDDDYTIVRSVKGVFGGIDKKNPRCEVLVQEIV